jgi:hypothetical protein
MGGHGLQVGLCLPGYGILVDSAFGGAAVVITLGTSHDVADDAAISLSGPST